MLARGERGPRYDVIAANCRTNEYAPNFASALPSQKLLRTSLPLGKLKKAHSKRGENLQTYESLEKGKSTKQEKYEVMMRY